MKLQIFKALLLIILLALFSCSGKANNGATTIKAQWKSNSESDLKGYRLFVWHGADTSNSPFVKATAAALYNNLFRDSIMAQTIDTMRFNFLEAADGGYIQAALSAYDILGNESNIAASNFLQLPDSAAPALPDSNFNIGF